MYRENGKIVMEEDEQIYGEESQIIDKKIPNKKVPYSDVFD